jgi:hypothetical protein
MASCTYVIDLALKTATYIESPSEAMVNYFIGNGQHVRRSPTLIKDEDIPKLIDEVYRQFSVQQMTPVIIEPDVNFVEEAIKDLHSLWDSYCYNPAENKKMVRSPRAFAKEISLSYMSMFNETVDMKDYHSIMLDAVARKKPNAFAELSKKVNKDFVAKFHEAAINTSGFKHAYAAFVQGTPYCHKITAFELNTQAD